MVEPRSDDALLTAVRAGDADAFGALFVRHRPGALRLARRLVRDPATAEDIVAEGFAQVLRAIRNGRGPTRSFPAYLHVAVRTAAAAVIERRERVELRADPTEGVDHLDPIGGVADRSIVVDAFSQLPARWREVLWHLEVEGVGVSELASRLELKPNAVSALAFRAREALRARYLEAHLAPDLPAPCRSTIRLVARRLRSVPSPEEAAAVDRHLAACEACRSAIPGPVPPAVSESLPRGA